MVNVGNGNLLVQSDDMSVVHKGIALAFRRTYNSFSQHDNIGSDSSIPSNYGNGWTNTFDAHVAYNATTNVMTVWDIDGTRYDYASDGHGHWIPPAGQFAALTVDGQGYYAWTKRTGTVYRFYTPQEPGSLAGFDGRLYQIMGRNHNIALTFSYYWDSGGSSSASHLNKIVVTAEDGEAATLLFADFNGIRELSSLSWPDGTQVTYGYDSNGNQTQVTGPGNNVASALTEQYSYRSGGHYMVWVKNPRQVINVADGAVYNFGYNASNQLNWVQYNAAIGPPALASGGSGDGSGTVYPGITATPPPIRQVTYTYTTSTTAVTDTDLHSIAYTHDAIARVTQSQAQTGSTTLSTTQGWDGSNNLAWSRDARGNETDYAYDAMGNTIAVGEPPAYHYVSGSNVWMRATSLYSYDSFNNVIAYCDPVWTHANGHDWYNPPAQSDTLCPSQTGTNRYTWTPPGSGAEPYGELTQTVTPLADNTITFSYNASSQGGTDYGLPTQVTGTSFTQADNSVITPQQSFIYDSHGNLICYNKGAGWWVLQYDSLNRNTAAGDPDDNALSGSACGKTTGQYATASYTTYFANGSVKTTQTASEVAAGVSTTITYDADGNQASVTKHFGGVAGTTNKFYDGLERLIDVSQPADSTDEYPTMPWITRYFYDLTAGGTVNVINNATAFKAYGNLYKSQEWYGSTTNWVDKDGTSYDALDRVIARYAYPPNSTNANCQSASTYASCSTTPTTKTNQYDTASDSVGLLTSVTDALGEKATFNYDSLGNSTVVNFSGDGGVTPARTYSYDPDGRIASIYSGKFGTQGYTYDTDGQEISSSEPSGGGATSPATLSYTYYPNGARSALSVSSSALTQSNLMVYSYRVDGPLEQLKFTDGSYAGSFAWAYTAAGRTLSRQDPSKTYTDTYDGHGQLSQYVIPAGTYASITHDPEGAVSTFSAYGLNGGAQYLYNKRGEMAANTFGNPVQSLTAPNIRQHGAMGYMFADSYLADGGWTDTGNRGDLRSGATVVIGDPNGGYPHVMSYDAAGRQTSGTINGSLELIRSYDAENHLILDNRCNWPSGPAGYYTYISLGYAWGPNGHPALVGSSAQGPSCNPTPPAVNGWETLHWDGDTLLFTTMQSGAVDDIKIGMLADYTPTDATYSGLTVWDRDMNGLVASSHNTSGVGQWVIPNTQRKGYNANTVIQPGVNGYTPPAGFTNNKSFGQGGLLYERAEDGYSDAYNVIQGVRTYDSQLSGWTAPDPYSGDVHNPASQKPYMYNGNNPIGNSDPTGSDITGGPQPVDQPLLTDYATTDAISMGEQAANALGWDKHVFGTVWVPGYQTETTTAAGESIRDAVTHIVWHRGYWMNTHVPSAAALQYWEKCQAVISRARIWHESVDRVMAFKHVFGVPYDVGLRNAPMDVPPKVPTPPQMNTPWRSVVEKYAAAYLGALSTMPGGMQIVRDAETYCAPLGWKP